MPFIFAVEKTPEAPDRGFQLMVFAALVKGLPFISMASFHGDAVNITWKRFIIQLSLAAINMIAACDLR